MQLFAHDFEYQSALGAHMRHLFAPWLILRCAERWYDANISAGYIGLSVTALGLIVLVIASMALADSARSNPYLHGSAFWVDLKGIHVSGRLRRWRTLWEVAPGKAPTALAHVYVGVWLDKRATQYLRHNGPESDFGYTWTTSGKSRTGRKLVVCLTLLVVYPESLTTKVTKDTKGSDDPISELRALRVLRGEKLFPIGLRLCRARLSVRLWCILPIVRGEWLCRDINAFI